MSDFVSLYNKNVNEFVETKGTGKFSAKYLSWAYAVKELKIAYPESSYKTVLYPDSQGNKVLPYLKTETGFFVTVELFLNRDDRLNNIYESWTHPVLNNNVTIKDPNSFQINTSIQRCLVKIIGIATGLGLSLYAGEDLPEETKEIAHQENVLNLEDEKKKKQKLEMTRDFKHVKDNGTVHDWTECLSKYMDIFPNEVDKPWFTSFTNKYKPNTKPEKVELSEDDLANIDNVKLTVKA